MCARRGSARFTTLEEDLLPVLPSQAGPGLGMLQLQVRGGGWPGRALAGTLGMDPRWWHCHCCCHRCFHRQWQYAFQVQPAGTLSAQYGAPLGRRRPLWDES